MHHLQIFDNIPVAFYMHIHISLTYMVRKTVEVDDELWEKMEEKAVKKFGLHGAIKKAINEALEEWVKIK